MIHYRVVLKARFYIGLVSIKGYISFTHLQPMRQVLDPDKNKMAVGPRATGLNPSYGPHYCCALKQSISIQIRTQDRGP